MLFAQYLLHVRVSRNVWQSKKKKTNSQTLESNNNHNNNISMIDQCKIKQKVKMWIHVHAHSRQHSTYYIFVCCSFVRLVKGKKKTVKIGWATWTHASNDGCTVSHRINSAQLSVVAWHKLLYDSLSLSLSPKSSLRSPSKHCRLFTDNKKKKTKKNAHKVVVSLGPSFRAFRESSLSLSLYRDSSREIVLRVLVDLVYTYTGDASKNHLGAI